MKNAIILCSGGLDSVVTGFYVKNKMNYDKMLFLFFNYGQKSLEGERKSVKKFVKDLKGEFMEIDIKDLKKMKFDTRYLLAMLGLVIIFVMTYFIFNSFILAYFLVIMIILFWIALEI